MHDFITLCVVGASQQEGAVENHVAVLHQDFDELEAVVAEQEDEVSFALAIVFTRFQNLEHVLGLLL